MHIQESAKHLTWSFLRKQLATESCSLFSQKTPPQMLDKVLNRPVLAILLETTREFLILNIINKEQINFAVKNKSMFLFNKHF